MDGKAVVRVLKTRIDESKKAGLVQVPVDYLEQVIDQAVQHAEECYDYKKMENDMQLEMFRSVISSGANALKSAFILNGGGAIALLSFYGRVNNPQINIDPTFISLALFIFSLGVFLTAFSGGTTYITQHVYMHNDKKSMGKFWQALSIVLTISAYGAFLLACHSTATALGL